MPPRPTRHRVAIFIALVGVAVSAVTWHVASQLDANTGYTSWCNVGGVVNCDRVIGSRYGKFLGVSLSVWSILTFIAGALLALPGALGRRSGGVADLLLLGLVAGSLGFAAILLVIAVGILAHACILCLTLDAVIVAWFVTVAPLAGRFAPAARDLLHRRSTAHAAIAGGVLAAIAASAIGFTRESSADVTVDEVAQKDPRFLRYYRELPVLTPAEVAGDARHVRGAADAPITIVEFSDFQCPACAGAFGDLHELLRGRKDVRLVFRHFPLDARCNPAMQKSLHVDACLAASASECAEQQGRFWEYHDLLFTNQRTLDRESLFRFARETGLDLPAFRTCLDDPATLARVAADVAVGTKLGVESTPTLFINGRRVAGALDHPYWSYALAIERQLVQGGS